MKTKSYFITTLLCLFTLLFATSFVFAGNIGRAVYGVLTETYNGASIDNPSAGDDYVTMPGSGYDNSDRIEGAVSTSVGYKYWFGILFNTPQDMSAYENGRIYFSAKVPTTVNINDTGNVFKVSDGVDEIKYFSSTDIKRIDNGSEILGTKISNDNQWHTYYIELSSFGNNLDLTNITYPFIVGSPVNDNTILIDNVYWTKASSETRSFNVTVKNISDNQVLTGDDEKITYAQSCFRQSWTAAQQYIELDLDQESSNWYIRVYLNNGKASRNGLYWVDEDNDENEIVLPMAWRVSPNLLPNSSGDTLQIAEVYHVEADAGRLYDYGKHGSTDPWWYPWIFAVDKTKTLDNYTKVWDMRGIHTYAYDHEAWDSLANFYDRKPKIYFAADCSKALGGLIYRANIVTELVYE